MDREGNWAKEREKKEKEKKEEFPYDLLAFPSPSCVIRERTCNSTHPPALPTNQPPAVAVAAGKGRVNSNSPWLLVLLLVLLLLLQLLWIRTGPLPPELPPARQGCRAVL
jgi:hypothetical protein